MMFAGYAQSRPGETSPILTPSSSLDSNATVRNVPCNSTAALPAQNCNPHIGQTFLVYGNNPAQAAPNAGQWQPGSQFQGPPSLLPSLYNLHDAPSIPWNPLNDRRFTGGPRISMPMSGPPEPQRQRGLCYVPELTREVGPTSSGGPINWQPWRQPPASEHGAGPGLDTCSNSQQGDAVIGPRMMDFNNEFEKSRYMDGLGLPAEGDSLEARLFRALNMSHYILIEHMDRAHKEMKQHVSSTINSFVDHTQNSLERKFRLLEKRITEFSKEHADTKPVEPHFTTPSAAHPATDPVDAETEDRHSLQHLEVAILKLWAHIDKIKDENHLRKEEKVERKEIEELLAGELLYHYRAMEKMKATISGMNSEISWCSKEICKLRDVKKELEDGTLSQRLPVVKPTAAKSCAMDDPQIPVTPAGVVADPQELLQKINEELEQLDWRHREKGTTGEGFGDECSCDLCGRARAGKSAGVTVENGHDGRITEQEDIKRKGKERSTGEEISPTHLGVTERKTTIGNYLAALNFTILNYAVFTNVTSTFPILQKWRDFYKHSTQGNQRVLEFMQPNGDVVILLIQPNDGAQRLRKQGYGLSNEEPGSPAVGRVGNVPCDPSLILVNSLEVISPPGPYPSTLDEALAAIGHPPHTTLGNLFGNRVSTAPFSNIRIKPLQLQLQNIDPAARKLPINVQSQVQPSELDPQVAKSALPNAVHGYDELAALVEPVREPNLNLRMHQQPKLDEMTPFYDVDAIKETQNRVIESAFEHVPYHMHRQEEAGAWENDAMQRFGRSQRELFDFLNLIDASLSKIKGYEASIKELKTHAAAHRALHSDGGLQLTTAPRLYIQADNIPKPVPSSAQTGPKPVKVEEVKDAAFLPGDGDKKVSSVNEKELAEGS
ncbi:hypothetical protein EV426DRAFT_719670 [Tirmania nivea]|nr:hypothetical protein EV426DRAFT_719670 [Tirmania nivea]